MIDKGQWWEFGQDTPTLYEKCHGILMATESQDLGLTSHPKDGQFRQAFIMVISFEEREAIKFYELRQCLLFLKQLSWLTKQKT